jgi:hypothetical protein
MVTPIFGDYGKLSEIGLGLKAGKPVIELHTWQVLPPGRGGDPMVGASSTAQAVDLALKRRKKRR